MTPQHLQSQVFSLLRFPLIVGVVFVHNAAKMWSPAMECPTFEFCSQLFSGTIPFIATPLFFLMSGYLFFYNVDFCKTAYLRKLRKRTRSLLVPYLLWNAASLLLCFVLSRLPQTAAFVNHPPELTLNYLSSAFWSMAIDGSASRLPFAAQFWFIRDLMVLVLLTPLVYWLIRKTRFWGVALVGVAWFLNLDIPYIGIRGFATRAWFFFMLGAYFSINGNNFVVWCRSRFGVSIYLLYTLLVVAVLLTFNLPIKQYWLNASVAVGIICAVKFAAYLVENKNVVPNATLASATFFVFAFHEPFLLRPTIKLVQRFFQPAGDLQFTLAYFATALLVVTAAVLIYQLLRRFLPRFTAVMMGR